MTLRTAGTMLCAISVVYGSALTAQLPHDSARVLSPVSVTATTNPILDAVGFTTRKEHGVGRYITREEIARKSSFKFTDLLRSIPGIRVGVNKYGDDVVSSPRSGGSVLSDFHMCVQYVVDGIPWEGSPGLSQGMNRDPAIERQLAEMAQKTAQDLNASLRKEDILGIEVYQGAETPPKFNRGTGNCATILVWTKESANLAR